LRYKVIAELVLEFVLDECGVWDRKRYVFGWVWWRIKIRDKEGELNEWMNVVEVMKVMNCIKRLFGDYREDDRWDGIRNKKGRKILTWRDGVWAWVSWIVWPLGWGSWVKWVWSWVFRGWITWSLASRSFFGLSKFILDRIQPRAHLGKAMCRERGIWDGKDWSGEREREG